MNLKLLLADLPRSDSRARQPWLDLAEVQPHNCPTVRDVRWRVLVKSQA